MSATLAFPWGNIVAATVCWTGAVIMAVVAWALTQLSTQYIAPWWEIPLAAHRAGAHMTATCAGCPAPLPPLRAPGHPRKWCSQKCRDRARGGRHAARDARRAAARRDGQ